MRRLHGLMALAALPIIGGCSTYQAAPINASSVEKALAPPRIDSVRMDAARLQHPLIKPLVIDGTGGFTPDEIAVMAVLVSPEMRALRDQRGVAEAQVVQAGILPNPQLGWGYDQPHGNNDPTLVAANNLGLSWDLSALLSHRDQVTAARSQARSVDVSVAWQEWQAAQAARLGAFRILSLEERLPLALQAESGLAASLEVSRKAVDIGARTLPDLSTATSSWQAAQNNRLDIEQQLAAARSALNLELGLRAGEKLPLKAPVATPALARGTSANALLVGLEDRRLDLAALKFGYESQQAGLRAAIWARFPKVGISVNRARDTTPVKTRGYAVTVDLPIFDRNQGQIAVAEATRQQLFDEYVARVAQARSEVSAALEALEVVRSQLESVERALPDLEKTSQAYERALASRNADPLAAGEAAASLALQKIERLRLRQQAVELTVALEIATGGSLSPGAPGADL